MENKEVLEVLNKELDKGNEVGIFLDKHDTGRSYDIIINGHGQNPVCSINEENFKWLSRNNYLSYGAMTKVGSHWYYDFNEKTRNGLTLYNLFTKEEFPFLMDKQFYIVPRGMKRIYKIDFNDKITKKIPILNKDGEEIGYQLEKDMDFTKIKEHATVYNINKLFDVYMIRNNHLYCKFYYTEHITGLGWHGNGSMEIEKQSCMYDVEQKDGKEVQVEGKYKDFDLITIDGKERYKINDIFTLEKDNLGYFASRHSWETPEEQDARRKEKEDKILNSSLNYFVTFSVGMERTGLFGSMDIYHKVEYLKRKAGVMPFEEYK